jgi:predicted nucleic acid-binding protein
MKVVVDTHVLQAAARAERAGQASDPALRLIRKIIDECPRIVYSPAQAKEALPHFRSAGFKLPSQEVGFLRELESEGKLVQLRRSSLKTLSGDTRRLMNRSRLHDDIHLFEPASVGFEAVITWDPTQLKRRRSITGKTEVAVLSVEEVLGEEE